MEQRGRVARAHGIPVRVLDGWNPRSTTRVTKWRKGQPSAWETIYETGWDDESRNYAIALDVLDQDKCPGCGGQLTLTSRKKGKPEPMWDVNLLVCTRCHDTAEVQDQHHKVDEERRKAGGAVNTAGRIYTARFMGFVPDQNPKGVTDGPDS